MQSYSLLANKLAITDYLNNKNIYGDGELGEDYSGAYGGNTRNSIRGNTRNSIRANRSYGSYDPMEGPGTPGERRVPNQRPLPTLSAAAPKETGGGMDIFSLADKFKKLYAQPGSSSNSGSGQYSGAGGSGGGGISSSTISNTSNVPGKEQIAKLATTQTQKKQQPMGVNAPPDQPLNKFSMAATDEPGGINDSLYKHVEMIEEQAAANTKWNRFKEAMKSGPGWDKFGQAAGDIAAAIGGRGTSQGRMGAIGSRRAGERIAERKAAPDVALNRELTKAKIADLKLGDKKQRYRSIGSGGLYDTETGETISPIKTKRESGIKYNEEKKAWFKGYYDDEGNFDELRELTPAEKKSQVTSGDESLTFEDKKKIEAKYRTPSDFDKTYSQEKKIRPNLTRKQLKSELAKAKETDKTPSPVTWTTATKELKGRFGKQDAIGNIIITPELQHSHRISQKKLVELKAAGVKPLDAINQAEDYARNIENRYFEYFEAAGNNSANREKVKKAFKQKYGYIPRVKR